MLNSLYVVSTDPWILVTVSNLLLYLISFVLRLLHFAFGGLSILAPMSLWDVLPFVSTSLYLGIARCSKVSFYLPCPGAGRPPPIKRPCSCGGGLLGVPTALWGVLLCRCLRLCPPSKWGRNCMPVHTLTHVHVYMYTRKYVCAHIWTSLINDELTPVLQFWSLPRVLCLPSFLHIHSCIVYGENPCALPGILEVFLISHSWLL